jgi:uncharacterized protein (DUF1697 family)
MALVVFLRGVNVGGHRTFRPALLAKELESYGLVNIGAAGTFVVKKPGNRARFRTDLLGKLPFATEIMVCDGRNLMQLEKENPFAAKPPSPDIVRFVSILAKKGRPGFSLPLQLPPRGKWALRILDIRKQFVLGEYRRHMKAIAYLGQLDKLLGVPATTRNWNTVMTVMRLLKDQG